MTNGTYEVAVSGASIQDKATFVVESQYVAEIQILNDVALTGKKGTDEGMQAFVYYKVLDQYEDDLTASTSIQWSSSCGDPVNVDRATGKLTFERSDNKAFTYNEQLFVTGVYTKTGKSVQKTLTIGAAQALHSIEIVGFVAKNGTEIKDTLPVGFKSGEFYMLYTVEDQNGNALKADGTYTSSDVTLISSNVLVVKDFTFVNKPVVVNGVEYNAVLVNPGQFVDKGGDFEVTAIAAKTGNTSKKAFNVGQNAILDTFTISDPGKTVADGESVDLPFTATDTNGAAITKFTTLADNLNKLSFSVSEGTLTLKEENDGTAKLTWSDRAVAWTESIATDNVARTISLTTVVVGGKSDTFMLSVEDKARPDAIYEVKVKGESKLLPSVLVEGDTVTLNKSSYGFLDQYGRKMLVGKAHTDNGFFNAASNGAINGLDFKGYKYDVMAEYKGSVNTLATSSAVHAVTSTAIMDVINNTDEDIDAGTTISTANAGNNLVFSIVRTKTTESKWEKTSKDFVHSLTVVDIAQVKNFEIGKLNKQYIKTDASESATGEIAGINDTEIKKTLATSTVSFVEIPASHKQKIAVKGFYNGVEVNIPTQYLVIGGQKLTVSAGAIDNVSAAAIKISDLYDATTAKYTRKDTSDVITVKVYSVYDAAGTVTTAGVNADLLRDSVKTNVTISDAAPYAAKINLDDTWTLNPTSTSKTMSSVFADQGKTVEVYDQYDIAIVSTLAYLVNGVKEAVAYADNNFKANQNDTATASVSGAERGDTFVLTVTANAGGNTVTKVVNATVGADTNAKLTQAANTYVDVLKAILETQRVAGLN